MELLKLYVNLLMINLRAVLIKILLMKWRRVVFGELFLHRDIACCAVHLGIKMNQE